ncbi:MAG: conjugal transfer protein TrbC, partial [Gammaproteobacteria bacterium]|nr:conjugal transfer protein TrbC [Gammaproteobacteria bacterium]
FAIFCAFIPRLVLAAGGSKLLNAEPLTTLQETISGPVLSAISVIMVVVTAVMMGFGEWGDGFKRLIQIVFWISIAAGASSLIGNIMG